MRRRKCSAVEIEREDEFDLPEIAQMIRVDIQELGLRSSVTVKRHKRKNSEIIIADIPAGLRDTVYCLAKNYVRSTWNDYHQHFGINFIPVVRLAYDGELTMCNFLSAIVLRSGEILCDPEHTDSHEDLVAAHNLRDNGHGGFVRIEFIPVNEQFTDVSSYKLVLDEPDRPEWFDDALEERILESLRDRVRRMIVDDERTMLLGGCWILGPNAIVKMVLSARIYCMLGSAKIGNVGGSAKIGNVRDNAQISSVGGSATIGNVGDSATIGNVRDSATIGNVRDNAQIGSVWGSAKIGNVRDSATIGNVWDSAKIGNVRDNAQIGEKGPNATVLKDKAQGVLL